MRRAQAAIEYLFMVMVVLMLIAIAIRYLKIASGTAGKSIVDGISTISSMLNEEMGKLFGS